ncbi:GNAT family N-acetyltransferase [Fredinandcohnia humi]
MFPILETERLLLKELKNEDAQDIFTCFSNKEVLQYYGQEPFTNIEQALELIAFFSKSYNERRGIRWGIQIKGSESIIGTIGFNAWAPKHKRAEVGYEIHPMYWRKGYAKEALKKIIEYGFHVLNLNRIGAVVFLENEASNQLLLKQGFKKEGILRDYMVQEGKSCNTIIYSLLK